MPTYVYECTKCRSRFELEQRMSDPPRRRCPECRSKVFRVISGGGGVIFKGNGFYATDYRSEEYNNREKEEKGAAGSKEGKEEAASG